MTPLHIQIALHYASFLCPYAENDLPHRYSVAVRTYTDQLVRAGMLTLREPDLSGTPDPIKNTASYAPTAGLRMYVDALCSVPLPKLKAAWVHPMLDPQVDE